MPSIDEFLMAAVTAVGMGWVVHHLGVGHQRLLVIAVVYYFLLPLSQQLQRWLTDGSDELQRGMAQLAIYTTFVVVAVLVTALLERRDHQEGC